VKRGKAYLVIFLILVFVSSVLLFSCSKNEPSQQENEPIENEPGEEVVEPTPTGEPKYGGTLRVIWQSFPKNVGDPAEMVGIDNRFCIPYAEMLVTLDENHKVVGWLAESFEEDPENKHLTFHLRKGVRFHDGTPFNAEAVLWNFERRLETGNLAGASLVESLEVIDEYTIRIHAKEYHSLIHQDWGWVPIFSPSAFIEAGGGDLEKSKEWARQNGVGTGPFKLVEYERDSFARFERNDDYWLEGYPYLDAIEIRCIPNASTAAALMEAGEADAWHTPSIEEMKRLKGLGFKENVRNGGLIVGIQFDSTDPNSPFADKRVREAVEYAIDRDALAKMVGQDYYIPLTQMSPPDVVGYNPDYNPRPYDPEKAKALLAEAGYPEGFETSIILSDTPYNRDAATAIQGYLQRIGIKVNIDIADSARYAAAAFAGQGFKGMNLAFSGIHPTGTGIILHYGPNPQTFRTNVFVKSPEFLAYCQQALQSYDPESFAEAVRLAIKQAGEDAMVVPLYATPESSVYAPYVHSNYPLIHSTIWHVYSEWMEK